MGLPEYVYEGNDYPESVVTLNDIDLPNVQNIETVKWTPVLKEEDTALAMLSVDSGTTWNAWNGNDWQTVDINNETDILAKGMTKSVLNNSDSLCKTDGLQMYLRGNDYADGSNAITWIDKSNANHDVDLLGFEFNELNGWTGKGLQFGGYNTARSTMVNQGSKDFTWELYLEIPVLDARCPISTNNYTPSLMIVNGDLQSYWDGWHSFGRTLNINTKYHIVMRRKSGIVEVFVDGVKCNNSFSATGFMNDEIYLGSAGGAGEYFTGTMYFVRIYDHALTDEEIKINLSNAPTVIDTTIDNPIEELLRGTSSKLKLGYYYKTKNLNNAYENGEFNIVYKNTSNDDVSVGVMHNISTGNGTSYIDANYSEGLNSYEVMTFDGTNEGTPIYSSILSPPVESILNGTLSCNQED
jgi:hypothetical protein